MPFRSSSPPALRAAGERTSSWSEPTEASPLPGGSDACAPTQGSTRRCQGNGLTCNANAECCSGRCEGDACLEAGTCNAPGNPCKARGDCCSGRCEPISGALTCLNYCRPDGAFCNRPFDCCSMACNGGTCGGRLCFGEGENGCQTDANCCSGTCDHVAGADGGIVGRCTSQGPCKGSLQECEGGGASCCSGVCSSPTEGRCDFGPGPCRPPGSYCLADTDCCRGPCALGSGGRKVCSPPSCLPDGQPCTFGADCCGESSCTGLPSVCTPPSSQCKLFGVPCTSDTDCCSGQCINGQCGNNCTTK